MDENCLEVARSVFRFPKNRSEKVNIRLITYPMNSKKTRPFNQPKNSLILNSEYLSCLAFQSASMQGKKKANEFFIHLQSLMFEEGYDLNEELIISAAEKAGLDLEMFKEDLYSSIAKNAYQLNKQLAKDMNVTTIPTCIIYYHSDEMNKARVESTINDYTLHYACNTCYSALQSGHNPS